MPSIPAKSETSARWDMLRAALRRLHPYARDVPGGMRFVLAFDVVRVGLHAGLVDAATLCIVAELGSIWIVDPLEMLAWNGRLSEEATAVVDDTVVVRAVVEATHPIEEIERRIQSLGRAAAEIKRGRKRSYQPALFAHYAH